MSTCRHEWDWTGWEHVCRRCGATDLEYERQRMEKERDHGRVGA